jgi:hypothetical protein
MVPAIRSAYNASFTPENYQAYLDELLNVHPGDLVFRVAETPIFVNRDFKDKLLEACEAIVDVIARQDFKDITARAIPENVKVPNEDDVCRLLTFDFGVCEGENGELIPQLIEMQGFPTLFAYQILDTEITSKYFDIPEGYDSYLGGLNRETYTELLKDIIVGHHDPKNVILMEIYPDEQKTRIDFRCTKDYVGIDTVCLTKVKADGKQLYYEKDGERIDIKRIYNRVIFDDLQQQQLPEGTIDLTEEWAVEWCPHPSWFYRISKYTLPFIKSPFVPETRFLNEVKEIPTDLENYVLKPLFSFAGQGVVIDIQPEDISNIKDPENWILQRKVKYADAVQTPDIPAKAEIRIFYFWKEGEARPIPTQNLARLSKGKMIGVRYNADKEWVGGTLAYFEQ